VSEPVMLAASYLGVDGFGNDRDGLRAWPLPLAASLRKGELDGLHWSLLSNTDPSRFLRMDLMCRLGFMAAELLDAGFEAMPDSLRDRTGICVESFAGSLDTDVRFAQTPRPSLFAYTLPSTVIGEICIRFRLKGPVLSLIAPSAGGDNLLTEASGWIRDGQADAVLCFSIEALSPTTANSISLPEFLRPAGWHAAALLLGNTPASSRSKPLKPGPLAEVCRQLCGPPGIPGESRH